MTGLSNVGRAAVLAFLVCVAPAAYAQQFGSWEGATSVDPLRSNGVNTRVNDGCPHETADGRELFFASNRSGTQDIYVAQNEHGEWKLQEKLPEPVNHDDADDFCPTPLPGDQLLFVSTRTSNCGGPNNPDIYYTRRTGENGWLEPQPLNCTVNSPYQEFSPSMVRAGGQTLLFFSSDRDDPVGHKHKIYMSVYEDGDWGPAVRVDELNFPGASDARPNVTRRDEGLEIVFDSTRHGGQKIFTAIRTSMRDSWTVPTELGADVNVGSAQSRASFSGDGTRLYFGSNAANVPGDSGADIFVARRARPNDQ
jgi:WD40 repeat protein